MTALRSVGFSSLLALALMCVTPATSDASPILDQSQTTVGDGIFICSGTPTTFTVCGQSFTVGLTGTLTSVDFYLNDVVGTPEAALYTDVSSSGATLAQTSATALAFGGDGFYSFLFNYPVSVGDVLFFGLLQESGDSFSGPLLGPDPYVAGGAFAFASPNLFFSESADSTFRTFVDTDAAAVPEPATLTLLALGMAGMGARRWRQRKGD
jgi:PEP-CTERM motif